MLSREEVLKIAHLARLSLTDEEVSLFQTRMGRVLEYMRELNQVKTQGLGSVRHVPLDATGLREDQPAPFTNTEGLMKNAPAADAEGFVLPAILEAD